MSPIGGCLGVLEGPRPLRRLHTRMFGTRDLGLQIRGRHLLRAVGRLEGQRVLDVGCGDGTLAVELTGRAPGVRITGMDLDERALRQAVRLAAAVGLANVRFLAGDATRLPLRGFFDLAIMSDVLEHLDDAPGALDCLAARLRPGGRLFIHVPSGRNPVPILARWLPGLARFEFPEHRTEGFSVEQITDLLRSSGLRPLVARPTWGPLERLGAEVWLATVSRRPRLHSLLHPLLVAMTRLDLMLAGTGFYEAHSNGLLVVAVKDAESEER